MACFKYAVTEAKDLKAIAAIDKIALNMRYMEEWLKERGCVMEGEMKCEECGHAWNVGIRFWAGSSNPVKAPFKITKGGSYEIDQKGYCPVCEYPYNADFREKRENNH